VARFVAVEQFGLAGFDEENVGTAEADQGTITLSWDDPAGLGATLAPGTRILSVRFEMLGELDARSDVSLSSVPTALEAADGELKPVPVTFQPGELRVVPPSVRISGQVRYYEGGFPVSGVTLRLIGGEEQTVVTESDGTFEFMAAPGENYRLEPSKSNDSPAASGVSTLDITVIRRHILGIALLDSPLKRLAADGNDSGSITTLDITSIRRLILGLTASLPAGVWRFVPSDTQFPDPANPWSREEFRTLEGITEDVSGLDFLGIKLGDVNASWKPL
jgi:hypothetical protein